MRWRRQHPTPKSYEEFLQTRRYVGPGDKYEDGYDYISYPENTDDNGKLYHMHIIRRQAALDLQHSAEDGAYITEQQIDNYLIANYETEEGEEQRILAARQKKYDDTLKMIRESYAKEGFYHVPPRPRTPVPVQTSPKQHDWDFFYRSLQAPPDTRREILTRMCRGTTPVFKSDLRNQRATMQAAIRKQRNVNAIIDTGAQVMTMPESAVNRMPTAHNHRDAPPDTAFKRSRPSSNWSTSPPTTAPPA